MKKKEKIEKERTKLYQLIEKGAPGNLIQQQSEKLDKHIANYYFASKC